MDGLHRGADRDKVKEEVVAIALRHHLVTRYTSLVSVDVTPARPADEPFDSEVVPTNLPQGASHDAIFGSLPKTATPAAFHLMLAMLAAAVAFVVYLARRVS
jgi:Ca-activated chloride channel family protein